MSMAHGLFDAGKRSTGSSMQQWWGHGWLFSTLLGLWEMGKSVEVQRLATRRALSNRTDVGRSRMPLFSVARGQSLDRRLLLTLCILQISFTKGATPSMKSPCLAALQNLLPRQSLTGDVGIYV
ncbi:unnamed protein product [Symbiodinium sp. CCMP2456]|nr:unnamed protein product [Symbiodinium sp. CCMP2456]